MYYSASISLKLIGIFILVFLVPQEYGDSVDIDGFDIDYGVRSIKSTI